MSRFYCNTPHHLCTVLYNLTFEHRLAYFWCWGDHDLDGDTVRDVLFAASSRMASDCMRAEFSTFATQLMEMVDSGVSVSKPDSGLNADIVQQVQLMGDSAPGV